MLRYLKSSHSSCRHRHGPRHAIENCPVRPPCPRKKLILHLKKKICPKIIFCQIFIWWKLLHKKIFQQMLRHYFSNSLNEKYKFDQIISSILIVIKISCLFSTKWWLLVFTYKYYLFTSCENILDTCKLFNLKSFYLSYNPFKTLNFICINSLFDILEQYIFIKIWV
jgi:hypothetical protein